MIQSEAETVDRNTSDIEWITIAAEYECPYKSFIWSSAYAFHEKKTPNGYIFAQSPIPFVIILFPGEKEEQWHSIGLHLPFVDLTK